MGVALDSNDPSPHQTALRSRGRHMLTHNHISYHSAFLKRLNANSNSGVNDENIHTLANYIRGRLILFGEENNPESRPLVKKMVEKIINKRTANQARFVANHMELIARHQQAKNNLNRRYTVAYNRIVNSDPKFRALLIRLSNTPNNEALVEQRNARLNRNRNIANIKRERQLLRQQITVNTNRITQHMRQIQAWKWVRDHVVKRV